MAARAALRGHQFPVVLESEGFLFTRRALVSEPGRAAGLATAGEVLLGHPLVQQAMSLAAQAGI